jgi:hypothetical protein
MEFTKKLLGLLGDQPNSNWRFIKIKAKVLIIAGDEDIIRSKQFRNVWKYPESSIMYNARETHFAPASNPKLLMKSWMDFENHLKDQIPTLQNGRNNCI